MCAFYHFNIATRIYPFVLREWMDTQCSFVPASFSTVRIANTRRNQMDYDYEILHTYGLHICWKLYEVWSRWLCPLQRYRNKCKVGQKKIPPAARALIVCEIYGSYLSIMWCYYLGIVNFKYDKNMT